MHDGPIRLLAVALQRGGRRGREGEGASPGARGAYRDHRGYGGKEGVEGKGGGARNDSPQHLKHIGNVIMGLQSNI